VTTGGVWIPIPKGTPSTDAIGLHLDGEDMGNGNSLYLDLAWIHGPRTDDLPIVTSSAVGAFMLDERSAADAMAWIERRGTRIEPPVLRAVEAL